MIESAVQMPTLIHTEEELAVVWPRIAGCRLRVAGCGGVTGNRREEHGQDPKKNVGSAHGYGGGSSLLLGRYRHARFERRGGVGGDVRQELGSLGCQMTSAVT